MIVLTEVEKINVHPSQMGKNTIQMSENFIIYIWNVKKKKLKSLFGQIDKNFSVDHCLTAFGATH